MIEVTETNVINTSLFLKDTKIACNSEGTVNSKFRKMGSSCLASAPRETSPAFSSLSCFFSAFRGQSPRQDLSVQSLS